MSVAYFIVLDNEDPGFDPFVNGKVLAKHVDSFEDIFNMLGSKSPDDYVVIDEAEMMEIAESMGLDEELDEEHVSGAQKSDPQWFDAEEGIQWSRKLRLHLEAHPACVPAAAELAQEFAEFESVFTQAKTIGARWRLLIDF